MARSAFLDKLNSIKIRQRLLNIELYDVRFSRTQQEIDVFRELEKGLLFQSVLLVEEFLEGKDTDFLFSDADLSHALYSAKWIGSESMNKKLIEFKSSFPYVESNTRLHVYDSKIDRIVSIFFIAIPRDADPVKLDELAERLDKAFRVQREILLESEKEVFIAINSNAREKIEYHEDREKPYSVTGSEDEYETLRQALEVVREIKPYERVKW